MSVLENDDEVVKHLAKLPRIKEKLETSIQRFYKQSAEAHLDGNSLLTTVNATLAKHYTDLLEAIDRV